MTTIRLINDEGMAQKDFDTITKALQYFVPLVTKAWSIKDVTLVGGGTPVAGDWLVYATEKNRTVGAAGYHKTQAGVPVAYCSLKASGTIFGKYSKPVFSARLKKILFPAKYAGGLVTTLAHEIAEMLCDPQIATLSPVDKLNRNWLVEVCDHCFGFFTTYTVDGVDCILPDVTTPAFYDVNGKAPFSILGGATAPFTLTPKGYAYFKDATGKLVKI